MKDEKWIDNKSFGFKPVVSTYRSFDELLASIKKPDESQKVNREVKKVG